MESSGGIRFVFEDLIDEMAVQFEGSHFLDPRSKNVDFMLVVVRFSIEKLHLGFQKDKRGIFLQQVAIDRNRSLLDDS